MKRFPKIVAAWLLAALTTAVIGVAFQTQNLIARLGGIGADVGWGERLSMTGYDIFYLGKPYALFIALSFMVAFLAGGAVFRLAKFGRPVIYAVAGGVAIWVMLFAMKTQFFDVHIIAGARNAIGIALQVLSGAVGGLVFASLSRKSDSHADPATRRA